MNGSDRTRRAFLSALAAAGAGSLAGCSSPGTTGDTQPSSTGTPGSDPSSDPSQSAIDEQEIPDDERYAAVYEQIAGSVASVRVYNGDGGAAQGSAFYYRDTYVITNQHVVADAETVDVRFDSTGWLNATVVATDVYSDLAVVSVPRLPDDIGQLQFVDSEPPIGTEVVAIGNPFGYSGSVSSGILSGVDRNLPAANGFSIPDAVQTDAPVNPGNSGGPLVDLDGRVVGVINAGGGDNIGFAISAALTKRVVPQLIESGNYDHSYMGVRLTGVTPLIATANALDEASGVYIHEVVDGGPADDVLEGSTGTQLVQGTETNVGGDVVVGMGGREIPTRQALSTFLALETSPGDTIDVTVVRDGRTETVQLTLGTRPEPR